MARKYSEETKRAARTMWMSGNYKSDKAIAQALGISRCETIKDWRHKENWEADRQALAKETQRKVDAVLSQSLAEMQHRHVKEYQAMQTKGVHALVKAEPKSVSDAVSLLDTGIKGERLVKGQPTEIRELRGIVQHNLQLIESIVGDIFQELLRDRKVKREDAMFFAEEFAMRVNKAPFRLEMAASAGKPESEAVA